MMDLIRKLVSIPSFTGNFYAIDKCIELCMNIVDKNAYFFEKNKNGYKSLLISTHNSLDFDVLSLCHIDVCKSDKYEMVETTDKIYGRGVFDMKSFVVSNLVNFNNITNINKSLKYGILITSDEEIGGENGAKIWANEGKLNIKIILDSDSGSNLESIIETNLGAITIKLIGNKIDVLDTKLKIKQKFKDFYCEDFEDEIDMNFDNIDIVDSLNDCMIGNTNFKILMLNKCTKNNVNDKFHKFYRQISQKNGVNIKYKTLSATNDSRYFAEKGVNVISHQSLGGNNHKNNEWLNKNDFYLFNKIQFEFLKGI